MRHTGCCLSPEDHIADDQSSCTSTSWLHCRRVPVNLIVTHRRTSMCLTSTDKRLVLGISDNIRDMTLRQRVTGIRRLTSSSLFFFVSDIHIHVWTILAESTILLILSHIVLRVSHLPIILKIIIYCLDCAYVKTSSMAASVRRL